MPKMATGPQDRAKGGTREEAMPLAVRTSTTISKTRTPRPERPLSAPALRGDRPSRLPTSSLPPWNRSAKPLGIHARTKATIRPQSAGNPRTPEREKRRGYRQWGRNDEWDRQERDRWGAKNRGAGVQKGLRGLQSRIAEAAKLPYFVDDVKRLRRAGGLVSSTRSAWNLAATGVPSVGGSESCRALQPLANYPESTASFVKVPIRINEDFSKVDKTDTGWSMKEVRWQGERGQSYLTTEASMNSRGDEYLRLWTTGRFPGWSLPQAPSKRNTSRHLRKDGERLKTAVLGSISSTLGRTSDHFHGTGGRGRRGNCTWADDSHTPKWSQKHEAVLSNLRQLMRKIGSPLAQAKDPAVLVGGLLKREPTTVARLDKEVLALEETAEALDNFVAMASILRDAGVSAAKLFTRAGVSSTGGLLGSKSVSSYHDAKMVGNGTGRDKLACGTRGETRQCTMKRIHLEIYRVLGVEVATYREFCTGLTACLRRYRKTAGAVKGGNRAAAGWINVDQLDHALSTCHMTRRILDPQGASDPPLTEKRLVRFLAIIRRSAKPGIDPLRYSSRATEALRRANSTREKDKRVGHTYHARVRARARKWNDDDRELAEREVAGAILERQHVFVEGYLRERRRYLNRRVAAQREGYGRLQSDGVAGDIFGSYSTEKMRKEYAEARKVEFREAVNRTKVMLKLIEAKVASPVSCVQSPEGTSTVTAGTSKSLKQIKNAKLERRDLMRTRSADPRTNTRAQTYKPPIARGVQEDDKNEKRTSCAALRKSTEAYSDKVGKYGGGVSNNRLCLGRVHSSAPLGVVNRKTEFVEIANMNTAALAVQRVFRRRMFRRFVWAQGYLRRPMHAFAIFKRICRPLGGANVRVDDVAAVPTKTLVVEGLPSESTTVCQASMSRKDDVADIRVGKGDLPVDTWPEAPGFNPSAPFHRHKADVVFLEYLRKHHQAPAVVPGAKVSTPSDNQLEVTLETSSALLTTTSPHPRGIPAFERKYAICTEAMRSTLLDIRLPITSGALDAAIGDLNRVILAEASTGSGGRIGAFSTEATFKAGVTSNGGIERRGTQNSRVHNTTLRSDSLSFATWYGWWLRHLPHDPVSTGCLLRTVRCARMLHSAEIVAFTGTF